MVNSPNEQITRLTESILRVKAFLLKDIDALTPEQLSEGCGGKSRCGYDLVYELTGMFDTFASRLRGEPQQPEDGQDLLARGWPRAPQEFKNKEKAKEAFSKAADEFVEAARSFDGDIDKEQFVTVIGTLSARSILDLSRAHAMYHSGQLNYIQTIHGDDAFHWF